MVKQIIKIYQVVGTFLKNIKISDDVSNITFDENGEFKFTDDYGYYIGQFVTTEDTLTQWIKERGEIEFNTSFPVGILKHIEIYDDYREEGNGNELYFNFEDMCIKEGLHHIILECDNTIDQFGGFTLSNWFENLGYTTIGRSNNNLIMYKQLR